MAVEKKFMTTRSPRVAHNTVHREALSSVLRPQQPYKTCIPFGSRKFGAAQRGFSDNKAGARCAITTPKFSQLFSFSKLLVVVLGSVSVEEPVNVEDAPSARFARYGFR